MAMMIDGENCSLCGECRPVCPTGSLFEADGTFMIDPDICNECDGDPRCLAECASGCIFPL